MDDPNWDMSDFLTHYTTSSNKDLSPLCTRDIFNCSLENDKSPQLESVNVRKNEEFCTVENLQERLKFLNQELSMLGFSPILSNQKFHNFEKDINANFDITKLVNCTYELLRRQLQQARAKDDLEARQMRSENDNEYLVQTQIRLKQDVENLKREAALLLCREKDQIEKCRILQQELKAEREEKRKMKADVDHLKKQFYHESKRTEKEITKLKDKVHHVLNDKNLERKIGINILNSLQRADGKRSTWNATGKKREEEMYKLVISNYEDKEKGLLAENIAMRDLLAEVQNMLESGDNSLNEMNEEDALKQYQMPFHLVKNDVEEKLKVTISSLKEKGSLKLINKPASRVNISEDDSFTIKTAQQQQQQSQQANDEQLLNKLEQYKAIIDGQEKIIQSMKDGYSVEAYEKLLKIFATDQDERVEAKEKLLKEQEKNFNEDRKQFTDYVLKLSKEKEEFEKERVEFYMKCLSTPNLKKDKALYRSHPVQSGNHVAGDSQLGKLQTVTPCFSPAPLSSHHKIKTPSTAELYKFMSMSYDRGVAKSTERSPFDGSFVECEAIDTREGSPSHRKLQEHVEKVRKAVEERHNKSMEEDKRKSIEIHG